MLRIDEELSPLISIIIPAYNAEDTIERCVKSALLQTYLNLEIIVVDDGSSDDTVKKIRALIEHDSRVKLIDKTNGGVSSARNIGIKAASGAWFTTLDDDDFIDPTMIESMYSSAHFTDSDLVICGFRKVFENGLKEEFRADYEYADSKKRFLEALFTDLYDKHLIQTHANKLYKTCLVKDEGIFYDENISVNEDIDFVLRYLGVCQNMACIRQVFLNYVQHSESLINTFQDHGIMSALLCAKDCRKMLQDAGVSKSLLMEADKRFFVHILAFVGLMYKESDYSKEQRIAKINELCSDRDFNELLRRLRPDSIKVFCAKMLLLSSAYNMYDTIYRLLYAPKS